jgi:hypothetical protein
MRGNTLRKIFVAMIIFAPVFSYTGCKKQAKCGCGKDVLFSFAETSANIYFNATGSIMYFQTLGDLYSTYNFCNPSEMFPNLADAKSGDVLQVSGHVYWDCNYVYQASNSAYQSYYKIYDVQVTGLSLNLYGKNKPVSGTQLNSATPQN